MQYVPKPAEENHNVSKTPVLLEAFKLIGGLLSLFLVVYLVLGFSMDWAVVNISEEAEDKYLAPMVASANHLKGDDQTHPKEQYYQEILDKLVAATSLLKTSTSADNGYHRHYVLKVKTSDSANAFAMPGGHIVLLTGLIDKVSSEDELVFVLAHELGHFAHKDHLRGMGRGIVLFSLSMMTGGENNPATPLILGALSAKDKQFSRYQETLADEYAIELMQHAGFNPQGGLDFMQTLMDEKGRFATGVENISELVSTHPATEKRVNHLRTLMEKH